MRSGPFDRRFPLVPIVVLLLMLPLLSACSRRPAAPPPPSPISIDLRGEASMNAGGNAAIVRVYLLASDAAFRRTPIQDFWHDDATALGADLVGTKREVLLYPGERETLSITPGPDVAFLGFAADLRRPDPNGWRVIRPIETVAGRAVSVVVTDDRLDVSQGIGT